MTTLLSTVYGPDPVFVAANKLGPDKIILFVDSIPDKQQETSVALLKSSLGRVIDIEVVQTAVYDTLEIARIVAEVIEKQKDKVYINITSGRKTKALGVLFGAYARSEKVKKIIYYPEEKGLPPVYLPILQFSLTDSQKKVLSQLAQGEVESLTALSEKAEVSRAMLYRNIKELEDKGLVENLRLTDAGKMAGV